jgi:hypothetical protein
MLSFMFEIIYKISSLIVVGILGTKQSRWVRSMGSLPKARQAAGSMGPI